MRHYNQNLTEILFHLAVALVVVTGLAQAAPLKVGGAEIKIDGGTTGYRVTRAQIEGAVEAAARATAAYFGKFPVRKLTVTVKPFERGTTGIFGRSLDGAEVVLYLGTAVEWPKLKKDWILAHEMFHLGFPTLQGQDPDWLGEGLATYQEPMARARDGQLTQEEVWHELIDGFTDALPAPGDGGLNSETRYRRIYWGGALFWFLMDLEIREKSQNKKSLDDALILIWKDHGTAKNFVPLKTFLAKFDKAVGYPLVQKYYKRFANTPATEDLSALWKKLGVAQNGETANLDDLAPWAHVRRSLTGRRP